MIGVDIIGKNLCIQNKNAFLDHKKVAKNNANEVYVRCAVIILSPYDLSFLQNIGQRQTIPGYRVVCCMQVMLVFLACTSISNAAPMQLILTLKLAHHLAYLFHLPLISSAPSDI